MAAYNGTVDVVYYGTLAASKDDTTACGTPIWRRPPTTALIFVQSKVSNSSNHVGVICTLGTACPAGTRNLLDLFEVAINPSNGKAGIIYIDDILTTDSSGNPLPQIMLAQQN